MCEPLELVQVKGQPASAIRASKAVWYASCPVCEARVGEYCRPRFDQFQPLRVTGKLTCEVCGAREPLRVPSRLQGLGDQVPPDPAYRVGTKDDFIHYGRAYGTGSGSGHAVAAFSGFVSGGAFESNRGRH
jgi:hypothetical protein